MKTDKTAIAMILDRSGSMSSLIRDTIGGFNAFIDEQKKLPGEATVTLVMFNDNYLNAWTKGIKDVPKLDENLYQVGGNTALLDAVGRTIDELGNGFAATPEADRPGKVIVVIMTDGQENASKQYNQQRIKDMVEHQQNNYKWEFVFIGAGIDAFTAGGNIGIRASHILNVKHDSAGTSEAYSNVSRSVGNYRSGGSGRIN